MGFGSLRTFNRLLGHLEQAAVGVLTVMNLRPASSLPIRLGKDCTKVEFPPFRPLFLETSPPFPKVSW